MIAIHTFKVIGEQNAYVSLKVPQTVYADRNLLVSLYPHFMFYYMKKKVEAELAAPGAAACATNHEKAYNCCAEVCKA